MPDFTDLIKSFESQIRAQEAQEKARPIWPTPIERINQYGHPGHVAWDIGAHAGDPVRAVLGGVIEKVIEMDPRGYGNLVIQRLPSGERIYYAHNQAFAVHEGQRVQPGQIIALAGSTGKSSGPHVHLEIRDPQGRQIDPAAFFSGQKFNLAPGGASAVVRTVYEPKSASVTTEQLRRAHPEPVSRVPVSESPQIAPGELKILETPLGDVSLPELPWMNIAAVAAGALLAVIGIMAIIRPSPESILEKVLPAAKIAAAAV